MKRNNIIYYTHPTLEKEHVVSSLNSLLNMQGEYFHWDCLYLYNANSNLCDEELIEIIQSIKQKNFHCDDLRSIPYDQNTPKTQASDWRYIYKSYNQIKEEKKSNIFFFKPDYCISKNFHREVKKYQEDFNFMWSLPVYNSKEWVTFDDIHELIGDEFFLENREFSYYRGSDIFGNLKESGNPGDELDSKIKFIAWGGGLDANTHFFSSDVSEYFYNGEEMGWGGSHRCFLDMLNSGVKYIDNRNAFCIHQYHEVKTKNNNSDRGDQRKIIKGQRY